MAGKQRPRNFIPLDVDYLSQDTIRDLLDEFGPAGPLVFLAVILEAHKQALAGNNDKQGEVSMRYRALGTTAGVNEAQARAIVASTVTVGLATVESDADGKFTIRLLKWSAWEAKDVTAARRQATARVRR
jgi:hypothetical protein